MELYDSIFSRREVHNFKNKTIPYKKLFSILEAGYAAHAEGNIPSTKIIIVETESLRNKISAISGHNWLSSAPILLVVCSDNGNLKKLYSDKDVNRYGIQNSSAVSQNISLAAREYDLQSAWVSDFSEKRIASLLNIPAKIQIHNILAIGHSDQHFNKKVQTFAYARTFYEEWKTKKRADKTFPLIKKKHIAFIKKINDKVDKKLNVSYDNLVRKIGKTIKHFK